MNWVGLLSEALTAHYGPNICTMINSGRCGGTYEQALERLDRDVLRFNPDLVILAFGMNDSAGVSSESYQTNTRKMIEDIRKQLPNAEFVLVASMLGNRDWTTLKHELFPKYRDALKELCEPGIALADMTSIWTGILERKQDWDQTGNGVNHPNDFGHRIYAQVIAKLLDSN